MLRVRVALLSVLLGLGGASLSAHPSSVSYARIAIQPRSIDLIVRLPLDDIDLLLRLDHDRDGRVAPAEIEASRAALAGYLIKHARIAVDRADVTPAIGRMTVWRDPSGFEYLEAAMRVEAGRALHTVSIHTDFLTDLYPSHSTQGQITAAGVEERFVFRSGTTYERRIADERWTAPAIVGGAAALLAILWFARKRDTPARKGRGSLESLMPFVACVSIVSVVLVAVAQADVIMTAAGLNATLKTLERLKQEAVSGPATERSDAMFRLGAESDALASLINDEVASHGMEQRGLIDLALSRTKELGIAIAYNRDKKKFFYDGAAFRQYLQASPRGAHAADAEFTLIAYQFYQSDGSDPQQVSASADAKKQFLARYPRFKANAELSLYLAIDYRDLYRHYRDANDAAAAEKYRLLTREEYQRIARRYPGTEQATSARQLLRRFDEETRQK